MAKRGVALLSEMPFGASAETLGPLQHSATAAGATETKHTMNLREATLQEWGPSGAIPTYQELQIGALLRIADAVEVMSKNHQALINDRDKYRRWYENENALVDERDRTIASLRGVITKLKKTKP